MLWFWKARKGNKGKEQSKDFYTGKENKKVPIPKEGPLHVVSHHPLTQKSATLLLSNSPSFNFFQKLRWSEKDDEEWRRRWDEIEKMNMKVLIGGGEMGTKGRYSCHAFSTCHGAFPAATSERRFRHKPDIFWRRASPKYLISLCGVFALHKHYVAPPFIKLSSSRDFNSLGSGCWPDPTGSRFAHVRYFITRLFRRD